MMKSIGGRKFVLAVSALASLNTLCAYGMIDGSLYITGLVATVGAYLAANVTQKQKLDQQ